MKEKKATNAKRVLCGIIIILLVLAAAPAALAAEYAVADGQTLDLCNRAAYLDGGAAR